MSTPLPVVTNLATATFECVFGRGCDGVCCRDGEPPVYPDEADAIRSALPRLLPLLRPEARALIEADGFLGDLHPGGLPKLRVSDGWCAFFNRGCVLHQLGAAEGDAFRYKPAACALFPLQKNDRDQWYVRQWGVEGERWDLFCLDPRHSARPAAESLRAELELARRYDEEG
jgi:Protein of unknown function (DUF3109)